MHAFLQDFRFSLRQLRKSPGFTLTAILTLALGVGANVIVFGVLNGLILKPLNVQEPNRLFTISHVQSGYDSQSYPDYADYRDRNRTFQELATYNPVSAGLSLPGLASQGKSVMQGWGYEVSGNYFDLLGVQPALGRFFHASDEHGPNSAPYVVVTYSFWRNRLNSDPHAIGSVIQINKHPFTLLGVAPQEFHGSELFFWPDFWMPMVNEEQVEGYSFLNQRENHTSYVLGRLKPGMTKQQATDDLNTIARQLAKTYKEDEGLDARLVKPGLMGDGFGAPARAFLAGVMFLALLVLVAACVNLASIFAARAADRSREHAIRIAIGSTRWRMLRQLLSEALFISMMGGAAGTLLAAALLRALSQWTPIVQIPLHVVVNPDATVYVTAFFLSALSGLLFGILPARQLWKIKAAHAMKTGANAEGAFRKLTLRDVLLGLQITICTLLVTSSLVALRGMARSMHADFGFTPQNVTLLTTDLSLAGRGDNSLQLQKRMLEQAQQIPGVTAVGIINHVPLSIGNSDSGVFRTGTTDFRGSNAVLDALNYQITPGYLKAAGTQLFSGRDFTWHDDKDAPHVAIVNASFARKMFGTKSAIGEHFLLGGKDSLYEIVGVVEDGKYRYLTEDQQPAMFTSLAQDTRSETTLVVHSLLHPGQLAPALQRIAAGADPTLPYSIHAWDEVMQFALFPARAATVSLGGMGVLAAMLAVTGVFGMAAYSVSKRMKELGIRIALGAKPMQLMRAALMRPVMLLAVGSVAGLVLGVIASGVLAHIVYQATPNDPVVLGGVVLTMMLLGMVATVLPARRAQKVDPMKLLRED